MNRSRVVTTLLASLLLTVSALGSGPARTAAADTATPPPGPAGEDLLTVTFPAETLPTGEVIVDFFRFTAQPGASIAWPAGSAPLGTGFDYVVSGSYGVRFEGPWSIVRAAGSGSVATPEAIAPGQEVVAGPGDLLVYHDLSQPATFRNAGEEPVVVLGANIVSTAPPEVAPPSQPVGIRFEALAQLAPAAWERVPAGPVTLNLRRMALEPGAATPPSDEARPTLRFLESGRLTLTTLRSDADAAATPLPPIRFSAGQQIWYLPLDPGWRIELSNAGDEPCVWLELTIT